jgi:outer membrane protein assembly factor BamB
MKRWQVIGAGLLFVSAGACDRPAVAPTWVLPLAGPEYGSLNDAVRDSETIFAVGTTNHLHFPPYEGDVLIVRADASGEVVWERTWGGDGYDQAWAVASTSNGGFLVLGETDSQGSGDRDFFLMRMDSDGETLWLKTYGTPFREWPFGMLALANGDALLFGRTQSQIEGPEDLYALRVTADGEVVWEYRVSRPASEIILDALETNGGDLVLCASSDEDPLLIKLTAEGGTVWEVRHELPGWQFGSGIAQATEGDFFVSGFRMVTDGSRHADVWLARFSPNGEMRWETSFGRPDEDDYSHTLRRSSDGNYLIGGLGNGMPLFKVDGTGTVLWESRLSDEAVHVANAVIETEDGGIVVAAAKQIEPGRSYDALLLKLDRNGRLEALP